jgi:acyl-CoA thioester hydrolase
MEHRIDIEVRFADLDAYGHVNNAVFFTYLETARIKLLKERFTADLQSGLLFLVAEANCRYLAPINFGDRVRVVLTAGRIGRSSFTLNYRIDNGEQRVFAEASTVMVCYQAQTSAIVPIPESLRQSLEERPG